MFFNGRLVVLKFVKRLAIRKRGMEALQAVVMIAIALVIASVLQTKGKSAASGIGDTLMKFVGGAADVVGGLVGKGIPFVPGI